MIGHKWQAAEGTIVTTRNEQMQVPGRPGMHWVNVHGLSGRMALRQQILDQI